MSSPQQQGPKAAIFVHQPLAPRAPCEAGSAAGVPFCSRMPFSMEERALSPSPPPGWGRAGLKPLLFLCHVRVRGRAQEGGVMEGGRLSLPPSQPSSQLAKSKLALCKFSACLLQLCNLTVHVTAAFLRCRRNQLRPTAWASWPWSSLGPLRGRWP